jgi:hypothetical protein
MHAGFMCVLRWMLTADLFVYVCNILQTELSIIYLSFIIQIIQISAVIDKAWRSYVGLKYKVFKTIYGKKFLQVFYYSSLRWKLAQPLDWAAFEWFFVKRQWNWVIKIYVTFYYLIISFKVQNGNILNTK